MVTVCIPSASGAASVQLQPPLGLPGASGLALPDALARSTTLSSYSANVPAALAVASSAMVAGGGVVTVTTEGTPAAEKVKLVLAVDPSALVAVMTTVCAPSASGAA